jgi:putative (di)nucleoside polyphosphate hydrolase
MSHGEHKLPYRRGVGALLFQSDGLVFVARRIDTPGDAWQLPQGGVDRGEKPRVAVIRELKEEIGTDRAVIIGKSRHWYRYDLPSSLQGRVWGGKYRGQKQRWFALRFLGTDAEIDLAADHKPEFDDWRWVSLATLPSLAVSFKRRLYADLATEFAPLAASLAAESREPGNPALSESTKAG